jgi:hypothetical protein
MKEKLKKRKRGPASVRHGMDAVLGHYPIDRA